MKSPGSYVEQSESGRLGPEPFRLDGKVALVTGAGRGIGAKCAEVLAQAGAKVVVSDILDQQGEAVAARIRDQGQKGIFQHLDVTSEEQWIAAIQAAIAGFGRFDVLVNNAGIEQIGLLENITAKEWRQLMAVNSDGVFLGTKQAILAMKPGGLAGRGGSIVNISSNAGIVAYYAAAAYSASKGAVRMLTKVAAVECGRHQYRIRVNSVHPGVIRTDLMGAGLARLANLGLVPSAEEAVTMFTNMHPIGRLGEPCDVAYAVLYLASDASDFITGSELVVDGGFTAQ